MHPLVRLRTGLLVLSIGLLACAPMAHAMWGADGVRVADPANSASSPVLISGANGTAFVAWSDGRSGYNTDVRATSWGTNGLPVPGWPATGSAVTSVTCTKWDLAGAPDGAGGAFLSWSDNRCTGYRNVYVGRLLDWGVWPPTAQGMGMQISPTTGNQNASVIIADASGGAYVAWEDQRAADTDVYLQRVTSTTELADGWPAEGVAVSAASGVQEKPVLVLDATGGVFVAWLDRGASSSTLRVQRYTSAGLVSSGWPAAGVSVATSTAALRDLRMIGDGVGGVLLAWADPQAAGTRVRAQRLRSSGGLASGWPNGGVALCTASGDRSALRVASDGLAGMFVAWQDQRGADADVYITRVAVNGAVPAPWLAQGLPLAAASGDQVTPDLAADVDGGTYVVWADQRDGNFDIRALRIRGDATLPAGWPLGGSVLCAASGDQTQPRVVMSAGEATVMWFDARAGGAAELYVGHLLPGGLVTTNPAGLAALNHDGQTFLTWNSMPDTGWTYRVYQRSTPITSTADLNSAVLLGSVGDSTAFDLRYQRLGLGRRTFAIDSAAAPLDTTKSLFVLPVPASRTSYYAVTAQLRGFTEDRRIVAGGNALTVPVQEVLATPRPVFQGRMLALAGTPDLYTLWTWHTDTPLFPAMSNRASFPFDCGVLHGSVNGPGLVRPHPRGGDFAGQLVHSMQPQEWVLGLDDYALNQDLQTWWYGYHTQYDMLGENAQGAFTSGQVIDYTNRRALHTVRWWRANFPFDRMRHYAFGYSMGGTASVRWGLRHPELFAAVMSSVGKLNFAIDNDPNPLADFNTGRIYRESLDRMWGPRSVSLPSSEGLPVYVANNGDSLATRAKASGTTFIVNFAGRNDYVVGWAEKPPFYAAMNQARLGGLQFWDSREHAGNTIPGAFGVMLDVGYLTRFRLDRSWPAFSNCSRNSNPGLGTANTADSIGTLNGYMDWDPVLVDAASQWEITLRTRALNSLWGTIAAPESLTVDVTPRRVQLFRPAVGTPLSWSVERLMDGMIVQQGITSVDAQGLVTVPQAKVYRTGVRLRIGLLSGGLDTPGGPALRAPLLAAFANPSGPRMALTGAWPVPGAARVELFDVNGRRARTLYAGVAAAGAWRLSADLTGLAPGLYVMRATQGRAQEQRRLVLVH